jgi:DMSO/TMAO reductase YedYZ molybdopterin-dependent catalytic subunit
VSRVLCTSRPNPPLFLNSLGEIVSEKHLQILIENNPRVSDKDQIMESGPSRGDFEEALKSARLKAMSCLTTFRFERLFAMGSMSRRRFVKYGVASALAALGVASGYFLTRGSKESSSASVAKGLPPGQSEVNMLEVLQMDGVPEIKRDEWALEVYGEVQKPSKLSWSQFQELPSIITDSPFHCVTGWTRLMNRWEGVRFSEIAKAANPTANAKYATIECYDKYTTSLPLETLLLDDVLFAFGLDGKELQPEYGGPLRLVVPEKYGYKSAKWVRRVKFTETQELGFWESRGYSNTADPWTEDRYARGISPLNMGE